MFRTTKEFHKAYTESYGKAMAYKELYNAIENAGAKALALSEQINNPKKYGI